MDASTEANIFVRSFNKGYELHQVEPDFAVDLIGGLHKTSHPAVDGFIHGVKQHQIEQELEKKLGVLKEELLRHLKNNIANRNRER